MGMQVKWLLKLIIGQIQIRNNNYLQLYQLR